MSDMQGSGRWNPAFIAFFALFVACVYWSIAVNVFQWRNPTANSWACYRHFDAVLTLRKLPQFQGDAETSQIVPEACGN